MSTIKFADTLFEKYAGVEFQTDLLEHDRKYYVDNDGTLYESLDSEGKIRTTYCEDFTGMVLLGGNVRAYFERGVMTMSTDMSQTELAQHMAHSGPQLCELSAWQQDRLEKLIYETIFCFMLLDFSEPKKRQKHVLHYSDLALDDVRDRTKKIMGIIEWVWSNDTKNQYPPNYLKQLRDYEQKLK
jgi:hypothetical protein